MKTERERESERVFERLVFHFKRVKAVCVSNEGKIVSFGDASRYLWSAISVEKDQLGVSSLVQTSRVTQGNTLAVRLLAIYIGNRPKTNKANI